MSDMPPQPTTVNAEQRGLSDAVLVAIQECHEAVERWLAVDGPGDCTETEEKVAVAKTKQLEYLQWIEDNATISDPVGEPEPDTLNDFMIEDEDESEEPGE